MKKIILASGSPRRKEILTQMGLRFKVVPSRYEEDMTIKLPPAKLATFLAHGKAAEVAERYSDHIVIGADSFVVLGKKLLGKPRSKADASRMLRNISGKKVRIVSGFAVIDSGTGKKITKATEMDVFIKKLTDREIKNYIDTGEPLDKAGAFAIQGIGASFIRSIEGDFFAAMGLSIYELARVLKKFNITVL